MANEFRKVTDQNGVDHPVTDDNRVSWAANAVLGAKNFWRGYISPDPAAGVTYTQNADKSISTIGTATGEESFGRLMPNADLIAFINAHKGETFVLNGCPSGGSHTTYYISIWANNGLVVEDAGSGETFTIPSSDCTSANIAIHVKDGVDVSGKAWKPMISFDGGEYAPPAMTNRELTEKVANAQNTTIDDYLKFIAGTSSGGGYNGDLNNLTAGYVYFESGATNVPVGSYGFCLTLDRPTGIGHSYKVQLAITFGDNLRFFVRRCKGSTWDASWKEVTVS